MRWFDDLSAGIKIALLGGVLLLALGYASFEAYTGFSNGSAYAQQVRDNRLPSIQALSALNTERMSIRAQTIDVLTQDGTGRDRSGLQSIAEQRARSWQAIDEGWAQIAGIPRMTDAGQQLFDRLTQEYRAWREVYVQLDGLIARMIESRTPAQYERLLDEYRGTISQMVPISNVMGATFEELVAGNMMRASAQADAAVAEATTEIRNLSWAISIAVLLGLSLAVLTFRSMVRPLRALLEHFKAIGGGSYDQLIQDDRKDEVGRALASLSTMQAKLKADITETRRVAAENLRIRYALDSVSSNVMVADPDAQIIYANDAVIGMFRKAANAMRKALPGFDPERVRGGNVDLFNLDKLRQTLEAMRTTFESENAIGGRTFKLVANPILGSEGDRVGTVIEWTDRTAELKVEQEVTDLVEGAIKGDFTQRITTEELDGFFERLGLGVNRLMERTAAGLSEVAKVLNAVAQGDLTQQVKGAYEGTFGELKDDTNHTVEQLQNLIGQITEAVEAINTGAGEIATGNADLSQRTEEQASSLEETASSMEELTSTVKQTADNARQADRLSSEAQEVAVRGGDKTRQAMVSMKAITESAGKIGEIITVIDGIAFQTNILALNAAVEAARAGEQGRGFAVVAAEVRNLAQRSASAAKEIKTLIAEDQRTIDAGSTQVMEAGKTMEEIVAQVKRVSDLIGEIAAASDEQSAGIEQVNTAITQMDEVTQQNASLVEEAAAAAESLEEQSQGLTRAVSVFKTDGQATATRAAAPVRSTSPRPGNAAARISVEKKAAPRIAKKTGTGGDQEWEEF